MDHQSVQGHQLLVIKIICFSKRSLKKKMLFKNSIFSGRWSKTQNDDQNQIYPSAMFYPFIKG